MPLKRHSSSLFVALLACVLSASVSACNLRQPASSATAVARGELYSSGNPKYDAFFKDVHDLQMEMTGTVPARQKARADLVKALGLPEDSSLERVVDSLKVRAAELTKAGAAFSVSGDTITAQQGPPEARALAQAASTATSGEHAIGARLAKLPERCDGLLGRGGPLEAKLDDEFSPPSRSNRVRAELGEAKRVILRSKDDARAFAKMSDTFAGDLAKAMAVPAGTSAPPPPPAASAKPPPKKGGPATGTGNPPPVSTTPPPPPPPGGDFNP